jgi:hypothetical protein
VLNFKVGSWVLSTNIRPGGEKHFSFSKKFWRKNEVNRSVKLQICYIYKKETKLVVGKK